MSIGAALMLVGIRLDRNSVDSSCDAPGCGGGTGMAFLFVGVGTVAGGTTLLILGTSGVRDHRRAIRELQLRPFVAPTPSGSTSPTWTSGFVLDGRF